MEQNWLKLLRQNCSATLLAAISAQKELGSVYINGIPLRTGHQPSKHHSREHSKSSHPSLHLVPNSFPGAHLFGGGKHSEPNSSSHLLVTSSPTMLASAFPSDELILPEETLADPGLGLTGELFGEYNLKNLSEPLAQGSQDHIILSHSESARNALIYIAVILAIYLIAVAFIAVQYYRKHSVLDPLTAYILRRSTRRSKDTRSSHSSNRKRRRYSTSSGSGFETIRSAVTTSSSMGLRNGSSNGMNGDGQSASCSGVRFDQHATVYSENGTTTTALESSKCDQVNIQINIEQAEDELEEEDDNLESEYYDDEDEEEDEEEEDEDEFEQEQMAVLHAGTDSDKSGNRRQRLKNLFHFHSHSTDASRAVTEQCSSPGRQWHNQQMANNHSSSSSKALTRSSSLQASDVTCASSLSSSSVHHHQDESPTWRPTEVDLLKFKRSSIAGFTVAASTGPLGLFKAQPRHYEETHL